MLTILLILPFTLLHIVGETPDRLASPTYKNRFGEIYEHTNRDKSYTRGLFYPLFLMHRYFFIFIIFACSFSGMLQVILMIVATSLFIYYLVQWRPFRSRFDFWLNLFSSVCLVVLYIFCLIFSILSSSTLGFLFIGLVLFLFVVNILAIIIHKLYSCHLSCKKKRDHKRYLERLKKF